MSSSISASDPPPPAPQRRHSWQRFLRVFAGTALGLAAILYGFVVVVDPWGMLPLSLPLARAPISTNARFSMPALAVARGFDAAIVGTSTSRLLRPDLLDRMLDARFVNLSMNSATPWEQGRMIALFVRHHPAPRAIIVGLDSAWCLADGHADRLTSRPFPEWMYGGSPWRGYLEVANLYALQEAANQFMVLIHARRPRYGADGYTNFLPPDARYDAVRVDRIFREWGLPNPRPPGDRATDAVALHILATALRTLPASTRKILYLPPLSTIELGVPGSWIAAKWQSCRLEATRIASATAGAVLVDFAHSDAVTDARTSFWDPVHYRVPVADRVMRDLASVARTGSLPAQADDFARVLVPAGTR